MAVLEDACRQRISLFFTTLSSGADGHVSGSVDYDVFGEPVTETGVFVGSAGGISALVFAYAGKPYDTVTGLSDYGFRDYAPTLARFTTVDPIRDGSNWYAYCNADPVNYVDAWGLQCPGANDTRTLTPEEIALYEDAGGTPTDYSKIIVVNRMPTVQEVRDAGASAGVDLSRFTDEKIQENIDLSPAMSLPNGTIYAPDDTNGRRPNASEDQKKALLLHEVQHQAQYQEKGAKTAYEKLIQEAEGYPYINQDDPYTTPGKGYLEYEAEQVEKNVIRKLNQGWSYTP